MFSGSSENPQGLGKRVPSLTELHRLDELVGCDLASAIDTLELQDYPSSKENEGIKRDLTRSSERAHGQTSQGVTPPPPPQALPPSSVAYSTWSHLLTFSQDEQVSPQSSCAS